MLLLFQLLLLSLWTLEACADPIFQFLLPEANSVFVQGELIPVSVASFGEVTFTLTNGLGYSATQVANMTSLVKSIGNYNVIHFIAPLGWTGVFMLTAERVNINNNIGIQAITTTITVIANTPAFGAGGFASGRRRHQRHPRRFSLDSVEVVDFDESSEQSCDAADFDACAGHDSGLVDFDSPAYQDA